MAESQLTVAHAAPILSRAGLLMDSRGRPEGETPTRVRTRVEDVRPGDVFLAYRGVTFDAHVVIPDAVRRGAALVVLEDPAAWNACGSVPALLVASSRKAWPHLAAAVHGNPEERLRLVGITGTNGKTSTTWIYRELLAAAGLKAMSMGTIGAWLDGEFLPTQHTTPDPDELFGILRQAVNRGITDGAMEVSSHALDQGKLGPIRFAGAGMTSFTRDHLDYHASMEEYFAAKWRLFTDYLATPGAPVGIAADVEDAWLTHPLPSGLFRYGDAASGAVENSAGAKRLAFRVAAADRAGAVLVVPGADGPREGRVPFLGGYALANFVLALSLAESVTGRAIPPVLWSRVRPVPGRLEPVTSTDGKRMGFVDYAHTPDALEKTLALLKPYCQGRLKVVFGCGGDRDRGKRPLMADVASRWADDVIVTSDNPRTEDPAAIITDIVAGLPAGRAGVLVEADRAEAIRKAVAGLAPEDVLVVAGKGHEDYQIIGKEKRPFDDKAELRRALG